MHVNGMSGEFYMPEILGPGVALFDYDNDGDLDVYLVQGGGFVRRDSNDRLYRNDLTVGADGAWTLRFTDVTAASRIEARGYGMGVATGDIDNDGWVDLPDQVRRALISCSTTTATVPSRTFRRRAVPINGPGACRQRSLMSIGTAGWISSSATICDTGSTETARA